MPFPMLSGLHGEQGGPGLSRALLLPDGTRTRWLSAGGQAAQEGALLVRMRVGSGPGTAGPVQGPSGKLDACCTLWGGLGGAGRVLHTFKAASSRDVNFSSSPTGVAHRFIHDSCGFFL